MTTPTKRSFSPCPLTSRQDFGRFYDEYAPILYGYLLGHTTNASRAQLRLAALFTALWQRRDSYTQNQASAHPAPPLRWLLQLVEPARSSYIPASGAEKDYYVRASQGHNAKAFDKARSGLATSSGHWPSPTP